jgi:hypothetical protein
MLESMEKYSPSAKLQIRSGATMQCPKLYERILPSEGVEERINGTQSYWRTWEKHLPSKATDAIAPLSGIVSEKPEKVHA